MGAPFAALVPRTWVYAINTFGPLVIVIVAKCGAPEILLPALVCICGVRLLVLPSVPNHVHEGHHGPAPSVPLLCTLFEDRKCILTVGPTSICIRLVGRIHDFSQVQEMHRKRGEGRRKVKRLCAVEQANGLILVFNLVSCAVVNSDRLLEYSPTGMFFSFDVLRLIGFGGGILRTLGFPRRIFSSGLLEILLRQHQDLDILTQWYLEELAISVIPKPFVFQDRMNKLLDRKSTRLNSSHLGISY